MDTEENLPPLPADLLTVIQARVPGLSASEHLTAFAYLRANQIVGQGRRIQALGVAPNAALLGVLAANADLIEATMSADETAIYIWTIVTAACVLSILWLLYLYVRQSIYLREADAILHGQFKGLPNKANRLQSLGRVLLWEAFRGRGGPGKLL